MVIAGLYSFKGGAKEIKKSYPKILQEIEAIIAAVKSNKHRTKVSKEKTMPGRKLYSPVSLNKAFDVGFSAGGWKKLKVPCDYSTEFYSEGYLANASLTAGAFREMDFIKERVGVEVQFGKYAFMVYNVCAKMTIFNKLGHIDCGIEIVPVKAFADKMSTGVSYFEQIVWDLEHRGCADIDIPVLIIGIDV